MVIAAPGDQWHDHMAYVYPGQYKSVAVRIRDNPPVFKTMMLNQEFLRGLQQPPPQPKSNIIEYSLGAPPRSKSKSKRADERKKQKPIAKTAPQVDSSHQTSL